MNRISEVHSLYLNHISEVHSLHLPADEIPPEPEEVANATAIPGTLKTLGIVRGLSKHGIPYLKLFFLSNDKEWYGSECGHSDNSVDENTCAFCSRKYYLSADMDGCNAQFHETDSTKTVFSVDMCIYSLVEVQNFRINLVNVSSITNSVGRNFSFEFFL